MGSPRWSYPRPCLSGCSLLCGPASACPLQPAWEMWHKERTGHLPGLVSNKAKPTGKPGRHSETSDFQRCFQNSRTCTHQRPDSPLWWVMRARYHSQHGHWAGSQPRLPHGTTRHHFRVRTYRTTASLFIYLLPQAMELMPIVCYLFNSCGHRMSMIVSSTAYLLTRGGTLPP
jgi:hypothetical protein